MRLISGIFAFVLLVVLSLTPYVAGSLTATSAPPLGYFLAFLLTYHLIWKINSTKSITRYDRFGYSIVIFGFGSFLAHKIGTLLQLTLQPLPVAFLASATYAVAALNVGYCLFKIVDSLPPSMAVPLLRRKTAATIEVALDKTDESAL